MRKVGKESLAVREERLEPEKLRVTKDNCVRCHRDAQEEESSRPLPKSGDQELILSGQKRISGEMLETETDFI